ncbi:MAG: hypothetical protein GY757_01750 [bacterium]|nr:hypothetical protein [bacterium]
MIKTRGVVFLLLAVLLLPAAGAADENFKIDIHGYISQGFLFSNRNNYLADTEQGSFHFNEMGINFSTELTDKLRLGIQLAARDLGDTGNDKVRIDWAYADYRWRDWLGLRVGKLKVPVGMYNKTRDIDMLRTFVLLPQGIYGETFRDTTNGMKGIGAYGEVTLNTLGDISYQVMFGTKDIPKESSITKAVEDWNPVLIDKYDVDNLYCGQIMWQTPLEGLRIGAFQGTGGLEMCGSLSGDISVPISFPPYYITLAEEGTPMTIELTAFRLVGYSLEYAWRKLVLAAEYSKQDQELVSRINGLDPAEIENKFEMFYGSVSYRFNKWFETGGYYSVFYKNRDDRDGTQKPYDPVFSAFQKDVCLSFRFDLNNQWSVKLEGHLMNGVGLCFNGDNLNNDGVPEYDRKWCLLAAKMTFCF